MTRRGSIYTLEYLEYTVSKGQVFSLSVTDELGSKLWVEELSAITLISSVTDNGNPNFFLFFSNSVHSVILETTSHSVYYVRHFDSYQCRMEASER